MVCPGWPIVWFPNFVPEIQVKFVLMKPVFPNCKFISEAVSVPGLVMFNVPLIRQKAVASTRSKFSAKVVFR